MNNFIVVDNEGDFPYPLQGAQLITSAEYLTDIRFQYLRSARVYNLSQSFGYQSKGYYVSLLSLARKHRVMPDPVTIQDLKAASFAKIISEELHELVQKKLHSLKSDHFELSIYFGRNFSKSYDELARKIFSLLKAPLLKVEFQKHKEWSIRSIRLLTLKDLRPEHRDFLREVMEDYFKHREAGKRDLKKYNYDLAILHNPEEESPPSNEKALKKFVSAAKKMGIYCELITKEDAHRLTEFDALFIRETTHVNHHTYRLARKAQAEGMVVIDDTESILKCSNKVFLEEILQRHDIPRPKTSILNKDNINDVLEAVGVPCILKKPDSAFSSGVFKAPTKEEFHRLCHELLKKSELIIVQEFLPSQFDWRVGILNNEVIFACKYYMADGHWQIINHQGKTDDDKYGNFETLEPKDVPKKVLQVAIKAAKLMGKGLYGVDLKEINHQIYLIEVNDNPNIDSGVEDRLLKDDLYQKIMGHFLHLLNKQRGLQVPL
jgi:glutathione synthase/RimK-type ligase-like ATP-grasp enzyme